MGALSTAVRTGKLAAAGRAAFTEGELAAIDRDAVDAGIDLWATSSEG